MLAHEFLTLPYVIERHIAPNYATHPKRSRQWLLGVTFWGCCVYTLGWLPAYLTGGEGSGYFAAVCLACALIHAIIYTRRDRLIFAAYLAPPVAAALVGSFFIYGFSFLPLVLALATARLAFSGVIAMADRHALFDKLRDNKVKREAAEKANAAKTQFLATMSHELRTPLNAVINYAEIVEEDLAGSGAEHSREDVARIKRAAHGLLGMIEDVMDYAQLDAGKVTLHTSATHVRALIAEAVAAARPAAEANGNGIGARVDESVDAVTIDAARLRQCLDKLLSNACKFTKNGVISVEARLAADMLEIAVADTGKGIAPEDQARLFRPFEQAEAGKTRASDGAGLGLAIVAQLATLMGGGVSVDSKPGAGSRFELRVAAPRVREMANEARVAA